MDKISRSLVNSQDPLISISVVSHQQRPLVEKLLASISQHKPSFPIEIILTENIPDSKASLEPTLPFPLRIIRNSKPKGFAANQNQAFKQAKGAYFAIVNPDVVFIEDVLTPLITRIANAEADIIAPLVQNSLGGIQDSFRPLPTPLSVILHRLGRKEIAVKQASDGFYHPDWIAGIFLLMKRETYAALGGFNPHYHLYFEDVDFGCRAMLDGHNLVVDPTARIIHDGQQRSRSNLRYFIYHLSSAFRFFLSDSYKQSRRN